MRKIFIIPVLLLAANLLQAQYQTTKFKPGTFTAEDEVTLTISVAGTPLEGMTELYIWIWSNANAAGYVKTDGVTNGTNFGESKPEAKMTALGNNLVEFKFTGTAMFGLEPGKLKHFQFLVKNKDGTLKISPLDSPPYDFEPIVFVPVPFRVFPNRIGVSDVTSVFLHQDLAPTTAEQRMTPQTVTVTLYDGNTQIGDAKKWNVKAEGNRVFSYSFIPNIVWTIPAGKTATRFTYRFDGTGKDVNGNTVAVTGTTTEKSIDALQ